LLHQKGVPADVQTSGAMNCARHGSGDGAGLSHFGRFIESDHAVEQVGRTRRSGPKRQPAKIPKPEKILQSFNTWAFKREQPDNVEAMLRTIADAVKNNRPIQFALYWGKGPRDCLDTPDVACLDYLSALVRRVNAVYPPGAAVRLVFTDTHAALNGHSPQSMHQYFGSVAAAASAHGFACCGLGELVRKAAAAGVTHAPPGVELPDHARQKLIACAGRWFHGEGTSEEGALRYFRMNLIEKQAIEIAFPSAIFVTFNGSEFRSLFPDRLPIFYMYSLRRGVSAKPWFLSSEAIAGDASLPVRG
jgi:L-tyrosine isonitrile synthase